MPPIPKSKSSPKGAPQRRKKAITIDTTEPTAALGISDLRQRLIGLEEANAKLLKLISRKRKEMDKFTATIQDIQQKMMADVSPIMMQMHQVDAEIHQIFQKIFTTRKMGKQTARMVKDVYMMLQASNSITFNPTAFDDEEEEEWASFNPFGSDQEDEAEEEFRGFGQQKPEEGHARQSDREETRQLRQVFLRLATVFHPDKILDEEQSEEYAEVMKEVNLAYQRGDLARLLAIEKQYELGATIDRSNADDLTLRCEQLERENQLLQEQKVSLQSELRKMKSSMADIGLGDYQQMQKMGLHPIDTLVEQAKEELEMTTDLRDFVQAFLDKKITVADFRRGPQRKQDFEDFLEDFDAFEDFVFFRSAK
jgi:hypothetical protein